jgi:polysaccharide export outer membrane protein
VLPVDWYAITQCADATTNYQLLPGDRVYVAENKLIAIDSAIGKIIAPAERIFGFIALGTSTVSSLRFFHRGGQGGLGGQGGF